MTNGLRIFAACMVFTAIGSMAVNGSAQEPTPTDGTGLFDTLGVQGPSSPSDMVSRPVTVRELRQARGQYQMQQRLSRLESNRWRGYEPLRPNWPASPTTTSRYGYLNVYHVPIYHYVR